MNEFTRAKINLNEGVIDLEGSEEFVQRNLDEFKNLINTISPEAPNNKGGSKKPNSLAPPKKKKPRNGERKDALPKLKPAPFDIDKTGDKPSLKEFLLKTNPQNHYENLISVAYYLEKYLEIDEFKEDNVYFVYRALSWKEPKKFHQVFIDAKNQKFYLEAGSSSVTWKLAPIGRNFIIDKLKLEEKPEAANIENEPKI